MPAGRLCVTSKLLANWEARRRVLPAHSIIDVGPGIRPQSMVKAQTHICVEPHRPYIARVQAERPHDRSLIFLNTTWQPGLALIPDKSIDSVFALDVIEHMTKEDGLKFLEEAKRVARSQVVIFTPLGYIPQDYEPGKTDRWGMDGGFWQTHRSGWTPDDLGVDWEFVVCETFHEVDQEEKAMDEPVGAFWGFWPGGQHRRLDVLPWLRTLPSRARAALASKKPAAKPD